jgi:hypothetical protein
MDARVRRVRQESDGKRGGRFSLEARQAAVAFAREGLGRGGLLSDLARALTVSTGTLRRWLARGRPLFRPVDIIAVGGSSARERPALVLQTTRGHRLEGLDVPSAIAVLRALEARA